MRPAAERESTWGVLRDLDFRRFWFAGVVSQSGSGVGAVALPLTAVLVGASAMDMGILLAAGQLPVLLLALYAGVWVDRLPRRPIMVVTNIGRALTLLVIPVARWRDALGMPVLWLTAFVVGALAVVFDLAATSYPPTLVPRERLGDANAVLTAGGSGAQIGGRGAAGWIVDALTAPVAIVVDALSFAAAAAVLATVRVEEAHDLPARKGVTAEIREGLAAVWRDPVLRWMVAATTVASAGGAISNTVFVLFAVEEVGMSAPVLGSVLAFGTAVGLVASLLSGRVSRSLEPGLAMVGAQAVAVLGAVILAFGPVGWSGVVVVTVAHVLLSGSLAVFSVIQISLRQAITPIHLLGRVNAVRRVTVFGIIPLGALVGGYLGDQFGLRAALTAAAVVAALALGTMALSPLRRATALRDA